MKAQKLGLVLGINMVAACLMMQGCKAPRPGGTVPPQPPPSNKPVITVKQAAPRTAPVAVPAVEPQAEQVQPTVQAQPVATPQPVVTSQTVASVPALPPPPPPAASRPSAVPTVKALPAAPAPKASKAKAAAAAATAAETAEYVVKPGDTLFLISKRTNFRQSAIVAANPGLKPDRLRVGQKIKLPGAAVAKSAAPESPAAAPAAKLAAKDKDGKELSAAAPAPAAADTKAPVKTKSGYVPYEGPTKDYTVKSGDSLGKIASECGISIRALKALNGLQKDNLRIGMKLKIPAEKQTAEKQTAEKQAPAAKESAAAVKKPDAEKAEPAASDTAAAAPAAPAAAVAAPAAAAPAETAKPADDAKPVEAAKPEEPPSGLTYKVKEGDDLVSIAIAYGISPSALMDLNDLKATDEIKPDQVLKLPPNAKVSAQ